MTHGDLFPVVLRRLGLNMIVYGVDFTSAPTKRKPITCARCRFERGTLHVEGVEALENFDAFETFLKGEGPWIAGFDFPFGQPWALLSDPVIDLPTDWEDYVEVIHRWGVDGWEDRVAAFRAKQPVGFKERERITDSLARSRSPMKFYNPPVAKMFWHGAKYLRDAEVSVEPCRPLPDVSRVAVEAYPALVARRFAGSYKSDTLSKQTEARTEQRTLIVQGLQSARFEREWELRVELDSEDDLIADASGDRLDAVLCAIQAGWAYTQRARGYGIPTARHPVIRTEGWIVDPLLAPRAAIEDDES